MERNLGARLALLPALVLALFACTPSRVDPDEDITLSGRLVRANGAAVPGVRVALTKEPDFGEVFSTFISVGVACLSEDLPHAWCTGARIATSGADGSYTFAMKGRDTQGTGRSASTLSLAAHIPRSRGQLDGPATTVGFQVQTAQVSIPLHFWEPRIAARGNPRTVRVSWTRVPDAGLHQQVPLSSLDHSVRFEQLGGGLVWEFQDARSAEALDTRLLEDSEGSLAVVAETHGIDVSDGAGSRLDLVLRSGRYPYDSPGGVPVSRGAPCFRASANGGEDVSQSPCTLTDGRFEDTFDACGRGPSGCGVDGDRHAVIDLRRTTAIGLVAVRGCNGGCIVHVSTDGRNWRPLGRSPDDVRFAAITPTRATRARFVRVSAGLSISELTEVSVWDSRRPPASPTASIITPLGNAVGPDPARQAPGAAAGSRTLATIVAAALAAAVLAGLAYRVGRASR